MHHVFTLAGKLAGSTHTLRAVGTTPITTGVVAPAAHGKATTAAARHVPVHSRAGIVVQAGSAASHTPAGFDATIEMTEIK